MQLQPINNNLSFGEKITFDKRLVARATKEEKNELSLLKRLYRDNGFIGEIEVKNNKKLKVQDIIKDLYSGFSKIETEQAKYRTIEDAFGNSKFI